MLPELWQLVIGYGTVSEALLWPAFVPKKNENWMLTSEEKRIALQSGVKEKNSHTLHVLIKFYGVVMSRDILHVHISNGQQDYILQALETWQFNRWDCISSVSEAAEAEQWEILKILIEKDFWANHRTAWICATTKGANVEILEWLYRRNIRVRWDEYQWGDNIKDIKNPTILQWLEHSATHEEKILIWRAQARNGVNHIY